VLGDQRNEFTADQFRLRQYHVSHSLGSTLIGRQDIFLLIGRYSPSPRLARKGHLAQGPIWSTQPLPAAAR
jgi:hypothetical protein